MVVLGWCRFTTELRLLNDSIASLENATQRENIQDTLYYQVPPPSLPPKQLLLYINASLSCPPPSSQNFKSLKS